MNYINLALLFSTGQNLLRPSQFELISLNKPSTQWIFYWLVALTTVLIVGKLLNQRRFNLSLASHFVTRNFTTLMSEGGMIKHPLNIILSTIFLATSGFFLSYVALFYGKVDLSDWNQWMSLKIMAAGLLLFFIKSIMVSITQNLFEMKQVISLYLNILLLSQNFMGIVLLVSLWLIAYISPYTGVYFGISSLSILWFLRMYKIIIHILPKINFRVFHFIIYLCTVEILPIVLAIKLYLIWLSMV